MSTVIHATHEAVQKVGGIGTVLEGLVTTPSYQKAVERTFLVGPLSAASDEDRIAREGKVLYSSITGTNGGPAGRKLDRVSEKYNVNLVAIRRKEPEKGKKGEKDPTGEDHEGVISLPMAETVIKPGDMLLLVADDAAMRAFPTQ